MLEYDHIQIAALTLSAFIISVMIFALFRSVRRTALSRRREVRLSKAFDRAKYVKRHG